MTVGTILPVLAGIAGVVVLGVVLARQGFPESEHSLVEASSDEGPTGEEYPPGSRPAGPGAETMSLEPSERMHRGSDA